MGKCIPNCRSRGSARQSGPSSAAGGEIQNADLGPLGNRPGVAQGPPGHDRDPVADPEQLGQVRADYAVRWLISRSAVVELTSVPPREQSGLFKGSHHAHRTRLVGAEDPVELPRYRVTRLCDCCCACSDVVPAYSDSVRSVILGSSLESVSVNPFSRCSVLSEPTAYLKRITLPSPPSSFPIRWSGEHSAVIVVRRDVAHWFRGFQPRVDHDDRNSLGNRRLHG